MSNALRTVRRKLLAIFAPSVLLGSVSAAGPAPAAEDLAWYTENFYSDASYSTYVGKAVGYCDGGYEIIDGYATAYSKIRYHTECP